MFQITKKRCLIFSQGVWLWLRDVDLGRDCVERVGETSPWIWWLARETRLLRRPPESPPRAPPLPRPGEVGAETHPEAGRRDELGLRRLFDRTCGMKLRRDGAAVGVLVEGCPPRCSHGVDCSTDTCVPEFNEWFFSLRQSITTFVSNTSVLALT